MQTALYVLAGWGLACLLVLAFIHPLLRMAKVADERELDEARAEPPEVWRVTPASATPSRGEVPSPQRLGYAGVVLDRLAHYARAVLPFERAWIIVGSLKSGDEFSVAAGAGVDEDMIGMRLPAHVAFAGSDVDASIEIHGRFGPRGALCVAAREGDGGLALHDRELLAELGDLVSTALAHHDRRGLARADSRGEVEALVEAMARADCETYRHCLDVAQTAKAVGARLGLSRTELVELELAALLHDVGKVRLPRGLLRKPGPLTGDERQLVELHPEWGAEMVARVPGLEAVALVVRLHHERPDGAGYPHGLPGHRIPVTSRVLSVCDAYGAMIAHRPYSPAVDPADALAELRLEVGTQFDGDVVEALADVVGARVAVAA